MIASNTDHRVLLILDFSIDDLIKSEHVFNCLTDRRECDFIAVQAIAPGGSKTPVLLGLTPIVDSTLEVMLTMVDYQTTRRHPKHFVYAPTTGDLSEVEFIDEVEVYSPEIRHIKLAKDESTGGLNAVIYVGLTADDWLMIKGWSNERAMGDRGLTVNLSKSTWDVIKGAARRRN